MLRPREYSRVYSIYVVKILLNLFQIKIPNNSILSINLVLEAINKR